ncbi:5-formyltetrahydrofolate cyclo-ligase [Pontiellaceae bacterium B1224]|nr:5-formyltetrahydrofolate cyclo-ligase [Pontiellaceae bacterium B1224]
MTKQQIRKEISAKRKVLDSQWVETASQKLVDRFQTLEEFKTSDVIALYKSIGSEVNLDPLFSNCWKQGKRTCIPVFNEQLRIYEMSEITDATQFRIGHYGIREPLDLHLLNRSEIDLIAVPGVGFDAKGNRLGRGGGYYDRMLAGFTGCSVGIAFDFQLLPEIPADPHDQRVRAIVTETKYSKV